MKQCTILSILSLAFAAPALADDFKAESPDIKDGERIVEKHIFNGFGCTGPNVSPELSWSGAPAGTKSFAVTAYDPDAPTGSGWWHWLVVNIPANVTKLPAGAGSKGGKLPKGALQTRTDFGTTGYGGPCPPPGHGEHHYKFIVYALKVPKIDVKAGAPAAMVGYNIIANELARASIEAKYSR